MKEKNPCRVCNGERFLEVFEDGTATGDTEPCQWCKDGTEPRTDIVSLLPSEITEDHLVRIETHLSRKRSAWGLMPVKDLVAGISSVMLTEVWFPTQELN